ncbi:MAG: YdcF family protein [bacterium]|nr:YdcF family protein [bacterium]
MTIGLILGSGVYTDGNKQYSDYLDESLKTVLSKKVDYIIPCGGITNPNLLTLSESKSIKQYLLKINPELAANFIIEDKSLTSLQNLQFARDILIKRNITPDDLYICCDSIRAPKNFYCAATLFNSYLKLNVNEEEIYTVLATELISQKFKLRERVTLSLKNIHIEGIPLDREIDEIAEQIASSLLEVGFSKYPALHEKGIQYRKKIWGME